MFYILAGIITFGLFDSLSEVAALWLTLFTALAIGFVGSRHVYLSGRWQYVVEDGITCAHCDYNLRPARTPLPRVRPAVRAERRRAMRRRSRLLRVAKWGGVGASLAIGALILVSQFWTISWGRKPGWGWYVFRGTLAWVRPGALYNFPEPGWRAYRYYYGQKRQPSSWYPKILVSPTRASIFIPLWLPFAIIGLPTARVWWTDLKRPKAGHCPCGYDLRGNVSGTCPECGVQVPK